MLAPKQSLQRALTRRLASALAVIGLFGAVAAFLLGNRYANLAYDGALFDNVVTLANQVEIHDAELRVNLPQAARTWLTSDQGDVVRYRIIDLTHQRVIESNGDLGNWDTKPRADGQPYFRDLKLDNHDFRVAYMRRIIDPNDWPVLVEVAESRGKRTEMSQQIAAAVVMLIGIMIAVAVWLIRQGIKNSLAPLSLLEAEAAQRSSTNLTPLDPLLAPQEVRGLIKSINHMMQRVSESIETQSRFIANAAHQLRTPLAGLRLQAQIALKQEPNGSAAMAIHEIETSAARAAHLIEQLLVLSKAESSNVLMRQDVDLTLLAHRVIERFLPLAIREGIDLGYEGPDQPVLVSGNEVLLTELLSNLVDNAIRYSRVDENAARVTIAISGSGKEVCLSVTDDGPGLGSTEPEKIFQRFHHADSADVLPASGAGLGLAIVKEIADRHEAWISIAGPASTASPARSILHAAMHGCCISIHFKPLAHT